MSSDERQTNETKDALKYAITREKVNICYGCFGAANNDCKRCHTERGK